MEIRMSISTPKKMREMARSRNVRLPSLVGVVMSALAVVSSIKVSAAEFDKLEKVACVNQPLELRCPQGMTIGIKRGFYGRITLQHCYDREKADNWRRDCMSEATEIVGERCDGREYCKVEANNSLFTDACPETEKYLQVIYKCQKDHTEPSSPKKPGKNANDKRSGSKEQPNPPREVFDGSPQSPHLHVVKAVNSTTAFLDWEQRMPESPIRGTYIYYRASYEQNWRKIIVSGAERPQYVSGLEPRTEYEFYLKSFNSRGISDDSNDQFVTMPAPEIKPSTTTPAPVETGNNGHPLFPSISDRKTTTTPAMTTTAAGNSPTKEDPDVENPPSYTEGSTGSRGNGRLDDDDEDGDDGKNDLMGRGNLHMCPAVKYRDVLWPRTRPGHKAEKPCPSDMRGMSSWRCEGHTWAGRAPDLSDCISPWLSSMDLQVHSVMQQEEEPVTAMLALHEGIMTHGHKLVPGDLKKAASKLLPKLAQGLMHKEKKSREEIQEFQQAFVSTSSELLSASNGDVWHELSDRDCRRAATSLVLALEDTGFTVANNMEIGDSSVTSDKNVVLMASRIDTQTYHEDMIFPAPGDLDASSTWKKTTDSIMIPGTSLMIAGRGGPLNIVFTIYNNLEDLIQPSQNNLSAAPSSSSTDSNIRSRYNTDTSGTEVAYNNEQTQGNTNDASVYPRSVVMVNSRIIGASIDSSKLRRTLPKPIMFTLSHLRPPKDLASPLCSFWKMDESYLSGRWSQEGCEPVDWNRTHTVCQCDHLTNFAVLMDISGVELSEEHELALRVITFVGCIISIVCLLLAWITFTIFKNLQCERNTIHKNLVFTLLLAEVLFVTGIAQTEHKLLCAMIAGGLHYLFLSAFAWMCLEGVQLYIMLVQVFEHEKSRLVSYYLFGYGTPLAVVAVSAAINYKGYGTSKHCWLTTDNYFILSFVGPACAVMLINLVMLSLAIYIMCRHSHMSATMKERTKEAKFNMTMSLSSVETFAPPKLRFPELPAWLKGAVVLVVLLGLTWAFGLLYLNQETVILAYVFTILNSLQGLFIFVFHCLKNDKVQKEYRKVARHTTWLPRCIRVNYGGYSVRASSSRQNSSGSGNYLSRLFGGKRKSAASTNSSAKPFLSSDQQRKSDIDNSASGTSTNRNSSSIAPPSPHPTSLNGYVYNPNYPHLNGYTPTSINSNGAVVVAPHTNNGCTHQLQHQLAPCYEEVVGELSQVLDCSMIDSEMVTEYCHNNLQVNQEKQRYSTGSEDSVRLLPVLPPHPPPYLDPDNLSNVSIASSSLVQSSGNTADAQATTLSRDFSENQKEGGTEEPVYEEVRSWAGDSKSSVPLGAISNERVAAHRGFDPHLNLNRYIISGSRSSSTSNSREKVATGTSAAAEPQASTREKSRDTLSTETYPDTNGMSLTDRSCSSPDVQFSSDSSPCSPTDKSNGKSQL
ncbi:adhesion g protein-coupled receptor l2 [Plakobranchus ocellatus]|uniref:Adhesion g protein-coupled receptor l2 n=1 Tax=Plakobranchus ocellatus TaxID=259542 RepID=A0AAV3YAD0_9GAST|nr:adhesion g protein-coupled receptor l2 [Plakobranchus ocellatus]